MESLTDTLKPMHHDGILLADMVRDYNADAIDLGQKQFTYAQLNLLADYLYQSIPQFDMADRTKWLEAVLAAPKPAPKPASQAKGMADDHEGEYLNWKEIEGE